MDVSRLIVYNYDHNTFYWVIQCFMDVLNHTFEQSEQLVMLIHFKGKATREDGTSSGIETPKVRPDRPRVVRCHSGMLTPDHLPWSGCPTILLSFRSRTANKNGMLAIGGDLSPERLLLAYRMGIFPWHTSLTISSGGRPTRGSSSFPASS